AQDLRAGGLGVEDTAGADHGQHAAHADLGGVDVDLDLGEVGAIGMLRMGLVGLARAGNAAFCWPAGAARAITAASGSERPPTAMRALAKRSVPASASR